MIIKHFAIYAMIFFFLIPMNLIYSQLIWALKNHSKIPITFYHQNNTPSSFIISHQIPESSNPIYFFGHKNSKTKKKHFQTTWQGTSANTHSWVGVPWNFVKEGYQSTKILLDAGRCKHSFLGRSSIKFS